MINYSSCEYMYNFERAEIFQSGHNFKKYVGNFCLLLKNLCGHTYRIKKLFPARTFYSK